MGKFGSKAEQPGGNQSAGKHTGGSQPGAPADDNATLTDATHHVDHVDHVDQPHDSHHDPDHEAKHALRKKPSRRDLLKGGGIAAAGLVAGAGIVAGVQVANSGVSSGNPYIPEHFNIPKPRHTPGFDHLVVVMGENRSFDNLLGYLYTPDKPPAEGTFDGLAFGNYSNTASDGTVIPAHTYSGDTDSIMSRPNPDPGEEYPHVNTQLFGSQNDINFGKDVAEMLHPYNAPLPGVHADMSGFVLDYESELKKLSIDAERTADLPHIMGSFDPGMLPVLSTLAREFGVFDQWFCAVPSQTFCNRSFFHASTSHGFVTNKHNGGYDKWLQAAATPTIFNRLEEAGVSWRIYFDRLQLISFTGVLHAPVLEQFWKTDRFATMEEFYADVENGDLPAYAFVEPRMMFNHNDFHPPVGVERGSEVEGVEVFNGAISDVRAGEALIHDIYSSIRVSTSESGSNYLNTALLITFDEHGGTYDHVAPPKATPPEAIEGGEMGFRFDRYGCRVPSILVSAHVKRGSVFNEQMHHGSVIATLCDEYGLEPLTRRDNKAPTLSSSFNREQPRHIADWPQTSPAYVPPNPEASEHPAKSNPTRPLSPPANGLIGLLLEKFGTEAEKKNPPKTFAEAYETLQKHGQGLFGVQ